MGVRRGQRVDAAHPFAAVVVAVAEEVIDDAWSECASAPDREVSSTAITSTPAKISDNLRDIAPFGAAMAEDLAGRRPGPSRKMPQTTRVALWNTALRETWMSIAQRRLRAAASAISGAAIAVALARPSNSGSEMRRNSMASE